ncbi:hypothetical protein A1359_07845 [Methylomonas lenta]|uniref:Uncharacterized protein n=1 Tax=Methylomonas lenta TaxID=980561 RepID=A0A177NHL1_9GAMM|nr:hypothetical protein A1359_07845 [Methylomonas lenta]
MITDAAKDGYSRTSLLAGKHAKPEEAIQAANRIEPNKVMGQVFCDRLNYTANDAPRFCMNPRIKLTRKL